MIYLGTLPLKFPENKLWYHVNHFITYLIEYLGPSVETNVVVAAQKRFSKSIKATAKAVIGRGLFKLSNSRK